MNKQAIDLSFLNNVDPKLLYGTLLGGGGALLGAMAGGKKNKIPGMLLGGLAGFGGGYFGGDWLGKTLGTSKPVINPQLQTQNVKPINPLHSELDVDVPFA